MGSVWGIDEHKFPAHRSIEEKIKFLLRYAVLAPSSHNIQPWRCVIRGPRLEVYRDEKYTLKDGDPTYREAFISIGGFIENFVIAAHHFGFETEISDVCFDARETLAAIITLKPTKKSFPEEQDLFQGITRRHTNRGRYEKELDSTILESITALASDQDIGVFMISDARAKERLAKLVGQAFFIAMSLSGIRDEMIELISRTRDGASTGMYYESMIERAPPMPVSFAKIPKPLKRWFMIAVSKYLHRELTVRYAESPVSIVIGTKIDGPTAWIKAGRAMERVLILAASHGITHDIAAGPIEIPTLVPLVRREIDHHYRPQILFRVGKPENVQFTIFSNRRVPIR